MSKMNPIHQCAECGVDLAHTSAVELCPPCYDEFLGWRSEEREEEEVCA